MNFSPKKRGQKKGGVNFSWKKEAKCGKQVIPLRGKLLSITIYKHRLTSDVQNSNVQHFKNTNQTQVSVGATAAAEIHDQPLSS